MVAKKEPEADLVPTELPPPTKAPPGTVAKVEEMIKRQESGQFLWNPNDAPLMSCEQWQWAFLKVVGDGHPDDGNPHVAHDIFDTESDF